MELRPNEDRARNAILLVWIVTAMEMVELVSNYMQYDLLTGVRSCGFITNEAASSNDVRVQIVTIVTIIVSILSVITFIQWFRRAYYNLHQQVEGLSYTEGWAAGSWFVPFLNMYRPYQIMKELYIETNHLLVHRGFGVTNRLSITAIGWWWAFWIISSIVGNVAARMAFNDNSTIDSLIGLTALDMFTNIIALPLGIITVKVIRDYSRVEPLMQELILDLEREPQQQEELVAG